MHLLVNVQVGKDTDAQAFLGRLDNDPVVGRVVGRSSAHLLSFSMHSVAVPRDEVDQRHVAFMITVYGAMWQF